MKVQFLNIVVGMSIVFQLSANNYQPHCYDMTEEIACGNADFPRQHGDINQSQSGTRFSIVDHGIVFDHLTQSSWMQCSYPGIDENNQCQLPVKLDWATAKLKCEQLELRGKNWHLPTIMELNSILELRHPTTKIDQNYFPDTQPTFYWSITDSLTNPINHNNNQAWLLNFNNGFIFDKDKLDVNYFRCITR